MDHLSLQQFIVQSLAEEVGPSLTASYIAGDPSEVVVEISRDMIGVGSFKATWTGPYSIESGCDYVGHIELAMFTTDEEAATRKLASLIKKARQKRRKTFGCCDECGKTNPPEWMHGKGLCQSCAEKNHGIVY